jgi:hypothetical protein
MQRLAELRFARSKHKLVCMPRRGFQFAALLASLVQSAVVMPLRTGEVARKLTEQDLAALEMVLPAGEKPWLLNGDRPQYGAGQYIEAFLPPTVSTLALRRGIVISVERRNARNIFERPEPSDAWVVKRSEWYAQVAITGRSFDQIQGDQDINRPFRVIGRFDDSELAGAVQSLRSDPGAHGVANPVHGSRNPQFSDGHASQNRFRRSNRSVAARRSGLARDSSWVVGVLGGGNAAD